MRRTIPAVACLMVALLFWAAVAAAEDPNRELMDRVVSNEAVAVEALLQKGADVNYRDPDSGTTPLIMASTYGFAEIARLLIEKGADVNLQDHNGATALIGACRRYPEIARLLLANGADVGVVSPVIGGPFAAAIMYAIGQEGDTSLAELLLKKGASVNEAATEGRLAGYTPLMMAVDRDSLEVVRFLVENGADVNARAADGATALSKAKKKDADPIVEYLQQHGAR
ncbi:MAG: ankyrin repeat domain-containing protein [Desulfobacterales bacterium]|jgi:ankyrin repeat protein